MSILGDIVLILLGFFVGSIFSAWCMAVLLSGKIRDLQYRLKSTERLHHVWRDSSRFWYRVALGRPATKHQPTDPADWWKEAE